MTAAEWLGAVIVGLAVSLSGIAAEAQLPGNQMLNNFVMQLAPPGPVSSGDAAIEFENPREGWVLISFDKPKTPRPAPLAFLDMESDPILWRPHPTTGALEAMRYLSSGPHALCVKQGRGCRLDIRAVPEIMYCYYPTKPHIASHGPYDWAFMERHVLSDVNVLVTRSKINPDEFNQWTREGRRWIANAGLPGLGKPEPPAVEEVYAAWADNPGVTAPGFSGLIVDEFCGSDLTHYGPWTDAVKRLRENPAFAGRTFYAWCGALHEKEDSLAFAKALSGWGYRFVWEQYMREAPSEEKALRQFDGDLVRPLVKWQAVMPDIGKKLIVCLGYLSAPPESLNRDPGVDYHVFMDLQFHRLATDPACAGIYGIMEYMADYADEESLRYAQKLFRHYCIEGKRTRYNMDPYRLAHIANPDFENRLAGWDVLPAEPGSIETGSMKGFSWLQGRYPETRQGDRYCVMRRSASRPNRVGQIVRGLKPGRLYSVKCLSADLQRLECAEKTTLTIGVDKADTLSEYGFQCIFPSCYSHKVEPYDANHPAHMSYHRLVFKAKARTARIYISDWASDSEPGGPIGGQTAFNFVEIQPFHP